MSSSESIHPDRPLTIDYKSKEFIVAASGAAVFTVVTVTLVALAAAFPGAEGAGFITAYSLLGTAELASLTTFVIGIVLYGLHQKHMRRRIHEEVELRGVAPVKVGRLNLPERTVSCTDYLKDVKRDLPKLFDAMEECILALAEGCYLSEGERLPAKDREAIKSSLHLIRTEIDDFLSQEEEVLRFAIALFSNNFLDEKQKKQLLTGNNAQILAGLSLLLPTLLDLWRQQMLDSLADNIKSLGSVFEAQGLFDDPESKGLLEKVESFKESRIPFVARIVSSRVKKAIGESLKTLPLEDARKEALRDASVPLLYALLPTLLSLYEPNHRYRRKVHSIFKRIKVPEVRENSWKAYIDAYSASFNAITAQLRSSGSARNPIRV